MKIRIMQAISNREILMIDNVEHLVSKDERIYLRIIIVPLKEQGVAIILEDFTNNYILQKKVQMTIESLENANKNLVSANTVLKTTAEELEIINEYLQSRNSEEIMAINEELMERISELESIKLCCETIINSMDCGIIIIRNDLSIIKTNQFAVSRLGFKSEMIEGESFLSLKDQINFGVLVDQVTEVMKTSKSVTCVIEYENGKRSKSMFNVSITPMIGKKVEGAVLIVREREGILC
jgi:PAS domain-containing protein